MRTQKKGRIAFAVCGSFCTLEAALAAAQQLTEQGWELLPIMSFAAKQDTRFGTGQFWQERLEALTSHVVLDTLQAVEPLGPKKLVSALVIAPCTGATLARLAAGLSDTPVTLAAKSLLRVVQNLHLQIYTDISVQKNQNIHNTAFVVNILPRQDWIQDFQRHDLFQLNPNPVRGATVDEIAFKVGDVHFNPRTPCGVRLRSGIPAIASGTFQSTHPVRGATAPVCTAA